MSGVLRRDLLQLLAAGGADRDQLLGAVEFLVVCLERGLHRQVLHLGIRQLAAEERHQRRTPLDGRAQLHLDLRDDTPGDGRHLDLVVGIGHHAAG